MYLCSITIKSARWAAVVERMLYVECRAEIRYRALQYWIIHAADESRLKAFIRNHPGIVLLGECNQSMREWFELMNGIKSDELKSEAVETENTGLVRVTTGQYKGHVGTIEKVEPRTCVINLNGLRLIIARSGIECV